MKRIAFISLRVCMAAMSYLMMTSLMIAPQKSSSSSYDVACIYESVDIPNGTKALDTWSNLKEVKAVYIPTKVDIGKYDVEVTRIDANFYKICGTNLYIETRYCYEYATREEVVLNISSNYGYTRGEVIFF